MKSSFRRLSFCAMAVIAGASAFGLFWSAPVHGRVIGGTPGSYCGDPTANATMCYNGATVPDVTPQQQASYLANKQATCGACQTSQP